MFQQDFANPVTRLAMQDYPVNGGKIMVQVFSGEKLLLKAPVETHLPAARVQGKIFFINELTQLSNSKYFVPEMFFCEAPNEARGNQEQNLFSLGTMVDLMVVLYPSMLL